MVLLAVFGPTWEPDWGSYSSFADTILAGGDWLHDAGLASDAVPLTLFRSIGYPLVVALFRAVLGNGSVHLYAIVLMQIALSLVATVLVWRLALLLTGCRRAALLASGGHAVALTMLYDQSLLSDSLYASLFVICWSVPLIAFAARRPVCLATLAGLGLLYGYSCLQRGTGLVFLVLVLPGVVAWAWRGARGFKRAGALVAFLIPMALVTGGDMAWNHSRTGQWIMTTGAQFVMIQPMVKAAGRGFHVFDGDTPIDALAAKHLRTYDYNEVGPIVDGLFSEYGLNAIQSAELHKQVFVRSWLRHPWAMTHNMLQNFNNSIFFQFFDPLDSAFFYSRMVTGDRLFPGFGAAWASVRGGNPLPLVAIVAVSLCRAVAYLAFATLLVGGLVTAWRAIRRRGLSEAEWMALGLWALFFGYTGVLCAIHMVGRFLPAALPAGLIAALFFANQARAALAARKLGVA
ncbi:MAG: hypothetical protein ACM31D_06485 [Bacteroidota bacterium]